MRRKDPVPGAPPAQNRKQGAIGVGGGSTSCESGLPQRAPRMDVGVPFGFPKTHQTGVRLKKRHMSPETSLQRKLSYRPNPTKYQNQSQASSNSRNHILTPLLNQPHTRRTQTDSESALNSPNGILDTSPFPSPNEPQTNPRPC